MSSEQLGPVFALLTALSWAIAVVLFKKSGDAIEPLALNLLKNCLGLGLVLISAMFANTSASHATLSDILVLLASGALGIGIADTLLFAGLNRTGAAHQAIVETIYSPAVVLFSFFMLGEVLSPVQALGGLCILGAVGIASMRPSTSLSKPANQLAGLLLGGSSMVLMAFAIVWVKPVLERHDVLFSTGMRLTGGLIALAVMALTSQRRRSNVSAAFRPQFAWRFALPGALFGTYLSLLCWIAAFKYAEAGVVALLNQTSTLFIVILAAKYLREPLTARIVVAVGLALTGSVIVLMAPR